MNSTDTNRSDLSGRINAIEPTPPATASGDPTGGVLPTQPVAQAIDSTAGSLSPFRFLSLLPYLVAICLTGLICWSVWPGFMSVDSFLILHQARHGVDVNLHPPMVAYVQWLCERLCPGPGAFFVLQVGTFFLAAADILVVSAVALPLAIGCLLYMALCPALLGPLLCVWKDTGMLAFFMAAFASLLRAQRRGNRGRKWTACSLFFIFMAAAFRHNGVAPAIPLVWAGAKQFSPSSVRNRAILTVSFLSFMSVLTIAMDRYRLPDGKPIANVNLVGAMQQFDLIGVAAIAGKKEILPAAAYSKYDTFTVEDLKRDYFPENLNKSYDVFKPGQKPFGNWGGTRSQIADRWWHALASNPGAYLKHRWRVTKAFLGFGHDYPYYITNGTIDPNDEGVQLAPNSVTQRIVAYVLDNSHACYSRPWFYYAFGLVLTLLMALRLVPARNASLLVVSAFLVALPMCACTVSADTRYHLWSLSAIILAAVLSWDAVWRPGWSSKARSEIRR